MYHGRRTEHSEAVFKGVMYGLEASGQGSELVHVEEEAPKLEQLRPTDIFQWWTTSDQGHTIIVHRVKTADGRENDESSDPAAFSGARVVQVAVLGGHSSYRAHGTGGKAGADSDILNKEDQLDTTELFSSSPTGAGGKTPPRSKNKAYRLEKCGQFAHLAGPGLWAADRFSAPSTPDWRIQLHH